MSDTSSYDICTPTLLRTIVVHLNFAWIRTYCGYRLCHLVSQVWGLLAQRRLCHFGLHLLSPPAPDRSTRVGGVGNQNKAEKMPGKRCMTPRIPDSVCEDQITRKTRTVCRIGSSGNYVFADASSLARATSTSTSTSEPRQKSRYVMTSRDEHVLYVLYVWTGGVQL